MNHRFRIASLFALWLFAWLLAPGAGRATPSPISYQKLPNGLEVFVVENHAVPLATVCVGFRGGAVAQSRTTAGLFHLYEHLLFLSNETHPSPAAFTAALNNMGVSNWNGGTGFEGINYYTTVPANRLQDAVSFWAAAVRTPVFEEATFENEKSVVINEIRGYHVDPNRYFFDALHRRIFPRYPWRHNIDGPEDNVRAATLDMMRQMQRDWYVPANAVLLVGGDVQPQAVFDAARAAFGDWQGRKPPRIGEPPQPGIAQNVKLAFEDADYYPGVSEVAVVWRGPDVSRQPADTWAADVLLQLMRSPVGRFKQALQTNVPGLFDPEYVDFNYPTASDGALFSFSALLATTHPDAQDALPDRAEQLRDAVLAELKRIAQDPAQYFGAEALQAAKQKLIDHNDYAMENSAGFVTGTLFFWWSVAGAQYFLDYEKNCNSVSSAAIQKLLRRYLVAAPPAIPIRVSTADAAADERWKPRAEALAYEFVHADNAHWWNP